MATIDQLEPPAKHHRSEAGAAATVVVRGLSKAQPADEALLREIFATFGEIRSVTVLTRERMIGTAFVDFNQENNANAAVEGAATVLDRLSQISDPASTLVIERKRAAAVPAPRPTVPAPQPSAPAAPTAAAKQPATVPSHQTLYVRSDSIKAIFDVFDFFKQGGAEGRLKECVYVTASKKPYFLIDCHGNAPFMMKALAMNGKEYKGSAVSVSRSPQSCAQYLEKKPDAVCSRKIEKKAHPTPPGSTAASSAPTEANADAPKPDDTATVREAQMTTLLSVFKPRNLVKR